MQDFIDLSGFKGLVIDDAPTSRSAMKAQLHQVGVRDVQMASSVPEARKVIGVDIPGGRTNYFDIILCDYYMGDGPNGQDLLEELRQGRYLKNSQVFFMVTAEAAFRTIIEVAEYSPDDYLIKPITAALLSQRLMATIKRKKQLDAVYAPYDNGDYKKAIEEGKRLLSANTPGQIEIKKLIAYSLVEMGHFDEARILFSHVHEKHGAPWALIGEAKLKMREKEYEAALSDIKQVIQANPKYLSAIDLSIEAHQKVNDYQGAFKMAKKILDLTPNNVSRLQKGGALAQAVGNSEAEALLSRAIKIGSNSVNLTVRTYFQLALIKMRKDGKKLSKDTVDSIKSMVEFAEKSESEKGKAFYQLTASLIDRIAANDFPRAYASLLEAKSIIKSEDFELDHCIDLLATCALLCDRFGNDLIGDDERVELGNICSSLVQRFAGTKQLLQSLEKSVEDCPTMLSMVQEQGRLFEEIIHVQMKRIAKREFAEAAREFERIATETRNEWVAFAAGKVRRRAAESQGQQNLKVAV